MFLRKSVLDAWHGSGYASEDPTTSARYCKVVQRKKTNQYFLKGQQKLSIAYYLSSI